MAVGNDPVRAGKSIFLPEAPVHANAEEAGGGSGLDIHFRIADVDRLVRGHIQFLQAEADHVRLRFPGDPFDLSKGEVKDIREVDPAEFLHRWIRLVGDDCGLNACCPEFFQKIQDSGIGAGPDIAVGSVPWSVIVEDLIDKIREIENVTNAILDRRV